MGMKKYLCMGIKEIESMWLPRWYQVPFDECQIGGAPFQGCIVLTPLPKGRDYKQHLSMLKTEKLLNGI